MGMFISATLRYSPRFRSRKPGSEIFTSRDPVSFCLNSERLTAKCHLHLTVAINIAGICLDWIFEQRSNLFERDAVNPHINPIMFHH